MTLAITLYAIVAAVLMVRPVAGHFAWWQSDHYDQTKPDAGDWTFAVIGALVVAAAWPLMLALGITGWAVLRLYRMLPTLPRIGRERAAVERQRKEAFAEALRDLELDNDA